MELDKKYNKKNIDLVISELNKGGITNLFLISGILATIEKETGFRLRNEDSYNGTGVKRLRFVFSDRVVNLNDTDLLKLTKDDYKFFEHVYGKNTKIGRKLGNLNEGDGYKYRGRGFNGLTGKGNYAEQQRITGLDLLNNPDLLNDPKNASKVLTTFYLDTIKKNEKNGKLKISTGIESSQIDTLKKGVKVAVLTTAGFPKNYEKVPLLVEGMEKAQMYAPDFLAYVSGTGTIIPEKKNIINYILLGVGIGILVLVSKRFISLK